MTIDITRAACCCTLARISSVQLSTIFNETSSLANRKWTHACGSALDVPNNEATWPRVFLGLFLYPVTGSNVKRNSSQMQAKIRWQTDWAAEWLSKASQLWQAVFNMESLIFLTAQHSWCTWNSNDGEMQKRKKEKNTFGSQSHIFGAFQQGTVSERTWKPSRCQINLTLRIHL